ncbi:MAG: GNAT family N-acetyltransferase [Candidatus Promineifilaceae bacterium]|nr:GNAT family N-acetyltransferase [Candidatus Promineifilaceae bacterium]
MIPERQPATIVALSPAETGAALDEIVHVYTAAFAPPPYSRGRRQASNFKRTLGRQFDRGGFKMIVAYHGSHHKLVGFGYGYTCREGQWWHDQVAAAMPPARYQRWLEDAFEIAELAVLPAMQGRGIGGHLHDTLLAERPHRTAVLSTLQEETRGLHLYRSRGWRTLLENFSFSGVRKPYRIMGRDLPGK